MRSGRFPRRGDTGPVLAAGPALPAAIVTEGLALRQAWLDALPGAAVSAASFILTMPAMIALAGQDPADAAIMAGGGLFGGLVYWLIAGRRAGIAGQLTVGNQPSQSRGGRAFARLRGRTQLLGARAASVFSNASISLASRS